MTCAQGERNGENPTSGVWAGERVAERARNEPWRYPNAQPNPTPEQHARSAGGLNSLEPQCGQANLSSIPFLFFSLSPFAFFPFSFLPVARCALPFETRNPIITAQKKGIR